MSTPSNSRAYDRAFLSPTAGISFRNVRSIPTCASTCLPKSVPSAPSTDHYLPSRPPSLSEVVVVLVGFEQSHLLPTPLLSSNNLLFFLLKHALYPTQDFSTGETIDDASIFECIVVDEF
jgi:hypothetical protein